MGDKVRIKVAAANLIKRQLDYVWVPAKDPAAIQGFDKEEPGKQKGKKKK
jgi:hypothetical protein